MKRNFPLFAAAVSCAVFLSCASDGGIPKEGKLAEPPASGSGFAPNTQVEIVVARARFVEDTKKVFGVDLVGDYDVIPIAIKLGLKGVGSELETVYANPQQMDFRLFLQDGTALEYVTAAKVAKGDAALESKLNALALREDDLPEFSKAADKYVFFRLSPRKEFDLSGNKLWHQAGHVQRALAIERSLMSFRVTRAGKPLPFYIGLSRVQRGAE
jgi:hypothetical protein